MDAEAILRAVVPTRPAISWKPWIASIAAAAAVIAAVAVGVMMNATPEQAPWSRWRMAGGGDVVQLAGGMTMRPVSAVEYRVAGGGRNAKVHLLSGAADFQVVQGNSLLIKTLECDVRTTGTDFRVDIANASHIEQEGGSQMPVSIARALRAAVAVAVLTGVVEVSNPSGQIALAAGEIAVVQPRGAPKRLEKDMGPGVGITIYNANFATVKERRVLEMPAGTSIQKFIGVASRIDPTSVHFKSLSDPEGVGVLEQNYEYDLVSPDKILDRYLDRRIALTLAGTGSAAPKKVEGVLKSFTGGQITLTGKGGRVRILPTDVVQQFHLGALPGGLLTRPTLVWKIGARRAGKRLCKVAYITEGINWKCDYIAVINKAHTAVDFSGWVTITNRSGATYKNARIKLIAGDVRRITPREWMKNTKSKVLEDAEYDDGGFVAKSFAEYHMYTLGRLATVNMNQVKQIELLEPALGVPILEYYEYPGGRKVNVKIEIKNVKDGGLGMALPKGTVRVHQKDEADGSLEFLGEDRIDHTPRDEKFILYIGDAFDIIGETTVVKSSSGRHWRRQTFRIELRNHKNDTIVVRVPVRLGTNWRIEAETINGKPTGHKDKDASTVEYRVPVLANGKSVLEYTVFNSWK